MKSFDPYHIPHRVQKKRLATVVKMSIQGLTKAHAALSYSGTKTKADHELLNAYKTEIESRGCAIPIPSKVHGSNKHGPKGF